MEEGWEVSYDGCSDREDQLAGEEMSLQIL